MTDYTPSVDTTIFPRINFIKDRTTRLLQRIANGRVAMFFKRLFSQASLDLNFAQTKQLDERITFSRASSATYVDADGLIKTTPVNLITYSEDFTHTSWAKSGSGAASVPTVTANYGEAPDGTLTADRIQMDKGGGTTTSDTCSVGANNVTTVTGQSYIASVWMK